MPILNAIGALSTIKSSLSDSAVHIIKIVIPVTPGFAGPYSVTFDPVAGGLAAKGGSVNIDWGDGINTVTTGTPVDRATHSYAKTGTYIIKLRSFNGYLKVTYPKELVDILQWSDNKFYDISGMFIAVNPATKLTSFSATDRAAPDLSECTNAAGAFSTAAFNVPINHWNVSNITNMAGMFKNNNIFNQPLNNWNVSKVTNMSEMFSVVLYGSIKTRGVFNQPIGNWDVSNVTNMVYMFSNSLFNQPLNNWNVGNVTNMNSMFLGSEFNQSLANWNVSKVTDMTAMFAEPDTKFNQPINNWNVSNVTSMESMFLNNYLFNQPLNNWNVRKVTKMNFMFAGSKIFDQNLSTWITGVPSDTQPIQFSLDANPTWVASKATTYPFLADGITRIRT
jgi:surface protein